MSVVKTTLDKGVDLSLWGLAPDTHNARNKQRATNFNQSEEAMSCVTSPVMFLQGHDSWFCENGYSKNTLIWDCVGEHTHAITTLLSNSLSPLRKVCNRTFSNIPRSTVYFHSRMTSTLVSNPVTFMSTTTLSLWSFSLMTSSSWTSAVAFILAAWRLPFVSIISKCSGFAECGRERKESYLTWIRILGFLKQFFIAHRPFGVEITCCSCDNIRMSETLEYSANQKWSKKFDSPNIRKKSRKEYSD